MSYKNRWKGHNFGKFIQIFDFKKKVVVEEKNNITFIKKGFKSVFKVIRRHVKPYIMKNIDLIILVKFSKKKNVFFGFFY